jgi:hypothetical protein
VLSPQGPEEALMAEIHQEASLKLDPASASEKLQSHQSGIEHAGQMKAKFDLYLVIMYILSNIFG